MRGLYLEILQRIVHKTHVPFIIKSQSLIGNRRCHFQKVRRILGNQNTLWETPVQSVIQSLDKIYRTRVDTTVRIAAAPTEIYTLSLHAALPIWLMASIRSPSK